MNATQTRCRQGRETGCRPILGGPLACDDDSAGRPHTAALIPGLIRSFSTPADAELVFERHHRVEYTERIDITAVEQVGIALDVIGGDATFFGDVVDDEVFWWCGSWL